MAKSKLVGEGVNGKHMHSYEETASGHWEWCNDCQCMVTNPCLHNEYICCYERSTYIRLKMKYEERITAPTKFRKNKKNAARAQIKRTAEAK